MLVNLMALISCAATHMCKRTVERLVMRTFVNTYCLENLCVQISTTNDSLVCSLKVRINKTIIKFFMIIGAIWRPAIAGNGKA